MFGRRRRQDDFDAEIESHLQLEADRLKEQGLSADEAYAAARRAFGNVTRSRERFYESGRLLWWDHLWQDLRFGLRMLKKNPGFTAVAVITLTLGIGANTAIFQLLDAFRLRSLPVPHPQELMDIRIAGGNGGMGINNGTWPQLTRPVWEELRQHHEPFSGVFAWGDGGVNVGQGADVRWRHALWVSGEFFPVLGVLPWRGRLFVPADEEPCPHSRAVVSYSFWQTQMGGRDIGSDTRLLVNGEPHQVIGVTPPDFFGLIAGDSFDVALPFCREELSRDLFNLDVIGRLRPGWTLRQASAQLQATSPAIFAATVPTGGTVESAAKYKRFRLAAYPAAHGVGNKPDASLCLMLGITGLVLLIACANLANLLLARATTREREVAVRLALGASRWRLIKQFLIEMGLLCVVGATLAIAASNFLSRALVWLLSTEDNPLILPLSTDWRVLAFAAASGALTCACFGIIPAVRSTRGDPVDVMKGGRSSTATRESFAMQRVLIVAQIAISLVLLVGAFLLVRSFRNLITLNPGMRESGITVAIVAPLRQSAVPPARSEELTREVLDDVRSIPGILGVATTTNIPLLGGSWTHGVHVGSAVGDSKFTWVSPGYFQTMGIPLIAGRGFDQNDTKASQRVAVVNQAFVRRFIGGGDSTGKSLRTDPEPGYPSAVYEIVGVIPDTKYNELRAETPPMVFAPASQPEHAAGGFFVAMMIHSNAPSTNVIASVKHKIAAQHPELVATGGDFQSWIRNRLSDERLLATLSGIFGLLAVLLAAMGLYGVISYIVARRRNEIGIRMALGAQRVRVLRLVMSQAGSLLLLGIITGTAISLVAARAAASLLFGLTPHDPLTLTAAAALLAVVTLVATFLPAHRASRLDPMVALRYE